MGATNRVRFGRMLGLALVTAAFALLLAAAPAAAADVTQLDPEVMTQLFTQLQNTPVSDSICNFCHGNIAKTDNYASEIKFTHANHIAFQCSSCHSQFPHRPEGTSKPTMKGCWDCHGLNHGPMGELAKGDCQACHVTPKERLRPSFHPFDWRGKPHVAPANKEFNTRCAMCHKPATCTECHDNEGVEWTPARWEYDSSSGCQSCHNNPLLMKTGLGGDQSFQVTGVTESAHQRLTCQECHADYRYDDKASATPLWTVNAGKACAECHRKAIDNQELSEKDRTRLSVVVEKYEGSTHAKAIDEGRLDSATCGSCHGGHFIKKLDTEFAKQELHQSAYRVCARCHNTPSSPGGARYDSYNDYYHGKAYKQGAPDAPACWECHGSHEIQPSSDPSSLMSGKNRGATCGQEGCHKGSNEKFGEQAKELIHQQVVAEETNPLLRLIGNITGR